MNRTQLEHIIRAASQISGDTEIVVIGSQAIHAQDMKLPPIVFQSQEADIYPRNHPERADDIESMPVDDDVKALIRNRIKADFAAAKPRRTPKPP
jgi:hypothetical protein